MKGLQLLFYNVDDSVFWPSRPILTFKSVVLQDPALFWSKCDLKNSSGSYESMFGSTKFCVCKLVLSATRAAFLAFSALKLKNIQFSQKMTPNEPKNAEKMSNFAIVYPVAFDWPLRPSLAFFIFFFEVLKV